MNLLPAVGGASTQEGGSHVVDNCFNSHHPMAAGDGDRLYNGLFHSYPAGRRHRCHIDQSYSGAETYLALKLANFYRISGGSTFGNPVLKKDYPKVERCRRSVNQNFLYLPLFDNHDKFLILFMFHQFGVFYSR